MPTNKRKPTKMELMLSKQSKTKRRGSTVETRVDLKKTPYPKTITGSLGIKPKKKSTK